MNSPRGFSSEVRPKAERSSELGWQKKKWKKKKGTTTTTTTTNFVPGKSIHFLVKVFAFLSLFQPSKTFSYVLHFHNLSKNTFWENNFCKKVFLKKQKKSKKIIHFFFFRFFFSLTKTYSTPFSFYFIVIHLLPTKEKRSKKRFARPVHFNLDY